MLHFFAESSSEATAPGATFLPAECDFHDLMCGISFIITPDRHTAVAATDRMLAAMPHRGPDDVGTSVVQFGTASLALGQRRLAIIDLSAAGHQPMVHAETGSQLTFNGEIYNFRSLRGELEHLGHRFVGTGDSEVLLHALVQWGVGAISKLQGMFAFAYFDARTNRAIVARDSIGIKPFYMARIPGGAVMASEVRAILATGLVDDAIDRAGVAGMLAFGAVQHPATVFKNIRSLPPGSYWEISADAVDRDPTPAKYWSYPAPRPFDGDVTAGVRGVIEESVRDHLISDVPLGVFLSSGIDSTIIAGVAKKFADNVRCFTVGFSDNPDMSEMTLAAETAKVFGLPHVPVEITAGDAEESTRRWLADSDVPTMDGMNVYVISRAIKACGITVALSGQGGDELFGGYPSFAELPRMARWLRRAQLIPASMRQMMVGALTANKPQSTRQKLREVAGGDGNLLSLYAHRRRLMSNAQLAALGLDANQLGLTSDWLDPAEAAALTPREDDPIWTISKLETMLYLGNMLLRDSDVNGMAHSLEIRVPLLDQRVLDFVGALPDGVRYPTGRPPKLLLRSAFADLLRPALTRQGKKGFTLPIKRWMLGPLREGCEAGLTHLKSSGLLEPRGVDDVWQLFQRESESPIWSRAWALSVLGMYLANRRSNQ